MHSPFVSHRLRLTAGHRSASGEGRSCERSHHLTVLTLFPHLDARPGPWLLLLSAACTLVAIRALELGLF